VAFHRASGASLHPAIAPLQAVLRDVDAVHLIFEDGGK
jgi:hypothetical protein